jgi:outer membrane protein
MKRFTLVRALPFALLWVHVASAQAPVPPPAAPPPPAPAVAPRDAAAAPALSAAEARARAQGMGIDRFFAELDLKHGLTSDEVARRVAASSPAAEARRASTAVSRAQQDQAVARLWPTLRLSARYTRLNDVDQESFTDGSLVVTNVPAGQQVDVVGNPDHQLFAAPFEFPFPVNQYELKASLSVPISDYVYRSMKAIDATDRATAAAEQQERATKRRAAADGRLSYYDWVRAIGQRIIAEQSLEQAQAQLRDATRLAEAGMLARADMLRAQAHAKNVEVLLIRTRNFQTVAEQRLRTAMGDRSSRKYMVGEDLLVPAPDPRVVGDLEALLVEAERNRSEFRVLRESEASLKSLAALQRSDGHPRLDAIGNFMYANPNSRVFPQREEWDPSWDVGAVLSWTPTDIAGANARAREQQARILELRAQRRLLLDGLRTELVDATSLISEAEVALASGREALLAAEESYRAKRELFQVGKGTVVDLSDAEVEMTRARLAVVNAAIDARTARVRLNHALGRDRVP